MNFSSQEEARLLKRHIPSSHMANQFPNFLISISGFSYMCKEDEGLPCRNLFQSNKSLSLFCVAAGMTEQVAGKSDVLLYLKNLEGSIMRELSMNELELVGGAVAGSALASADLGASLSAAVTSVVSTAFGLTSTLTGALTSLASLASLTGSLTSLTGGLAGSLTSSLGGLTGSLGGLTGGLGGLTGGLDGLGGLLGGLTGGGSVSGGVGV